MAKELGWKTLMRDRLEFRRLLQSYSLLDLVGDPNESIEWFRQIMLELAGWVGEKERAREILQRFMEEYARQREEREMFERAVATKCQEKGERHQGDEPSNPHVMKKFRRFSI